MIWIDSSFAIEWLLGTERAKEVKLGGEPRGILPMQYVEVFVFFIRRGEDAVRLSGQLEPLELTTPSRHHLHHAALLYLQARKKKSKASMADAVLAAVAHETREKIAAFDNDFTELGLRGEGGIWSPQGPGG